MQPEQPIDQNVPQEEYTQPEYSEAADFEQVSETQPIQWQAPEYVQERRSPWWFIAFWVIAALLMVVAFFVLQSWSFALLVPAMAAALMIYSHRPPRILNYVLSGKGIYINEKLHPIGEFRSFGIMRDEAIPSIMFIPVKRFRPALTIHFPEEIGEAVVDLLGHRIPMQELKLDLFDQIIRKLHIQ